MALPSMADTSTSSSSSSGGRRRWSGAAGPLSTLSSPRPPLLLVLAVTVLSMAVVLPRHAAADWIPSSVECKGHEWQVTLCDVDWAAYHANPSSAPMHRDLLRYCAGGSEMKMGLAALEKWLTEHHVPPGADPAGIVFHIGRCGSTLVANMFGTLQDTAMIVEGALNTVLQESACGTTPAARAANYRVLVRAMQGPHHKRVVVKTQSAISPILRDVVRMFPATPWVFVVRHPVEVVASFLRMTEPAAVTSSGSPCLRWRGDAPAAFKQFLKERSAPEISTMSDQELCTASIGWLLQQGAIAAASSTSGMVIDYTELPEAVVSRIAPHFHITLSAAQQTAMLQQGELYSKSRDEPKAFEDDTLSKQAAAAPKISKFAEKYALDSFSALIRAPTPPPTGTVPLAPADDDLVYPRLFPLADILTHWNPDIPKPPVDAAKYDSVARLNYQDANEFAMALALREAELPFVIYNIPSLNKAVSKWTDDYLDQELGDDNRAEISTSNHFMYYARVFIGTRPVKDGNWKPPVQERQMTYAEWLVHAEHRPLTNSDPHYYYRASADSPSGHNGFIFNDLEFFKGTGFFVVDESQQRGIHCRFGMEGIIAEAHFDGGRNFISMVRGSKRYILSPPSQCKNLKYLKEGPMRRHSAVDWSDHTHVSLRYADYNNVADDSFNEAASMDVILSAGEVLYLPAFWNHFIVSLTTNIQCNTRSGSPPIDEDHMKECGFAVQINQPEKAQTARKEHAGLLARLGLQPVRPGSSANATVPVTRLRSVSKAAWSSGQRATKAWSVPIILGGLAACLTLYAARFWWQRRARYLGGSV